MILSTETKNLLKKTALTYRAINHKLRQNIYSYLEEVGRQTVTELYVYFRLEQSVTSQHLAILRKAGFVKTERDGKFIYYSVNNERVAKVIEISKLIIQ